MHTKNAREVCLAFKNEFSEGIHFFFLKLYEGGYYSVKNFISEKLTEEIFL